MDGGGDGGERERRRLTMKSAAEHRDPIVAGWTAPQWTSYTRSRATDRTHDNRYKCHNCVRCPTRSACVLVHAAGLLTAAVTVTCDRRDDCCCNQAANDSANDRPDAGRTTAAAAAGGTGPCRLSTVVRSQGHAQATNLRRNAISLSHVLVARGAVEAQCVILTQCLATWDSTSCAIAFAEPLAAVFIPCWNRTWEAMLSCGAAAMLTTETL